VVVVVVEVVWGVRGGEQQQQRQQRVASQVESREQAGARPWNEGLEWCICTCRRRCRP
jgi:hypothetical protein